MKEREFGLLTEGKERKRGQDYFGLQQGKDIEGIKREEDIIEREREGNPERKQIFFFITFQISIAGGRREREGGDQREVVFFK